jgi:tetratricopeptide (TPR) repeat protein
MTLRSTAQLPRIRQSALLTSAALLLAAHAVLAQVPAKAPTQTPAQTAAPSASTLKPHPKPAPAPTAGEPDRAAAYYHDGLAHLYEELAVNNGRPDYAAQAIEEYKLALNADPGSPYLEDGLADLYFKLGRIREAVTSAQDQIKKNPNDISAHSLLGKVYLRSLGDMQSQQAGQMLQLAIAEYEKLAKLQPKDLETHLLLGQLYGLNRDNVKAEEQFKLAQALDGNSEDAVLNMARLYSEQGQAQRAVDVLTSIPADDRSGRVDFALGASYDELKKPKEAAAAYKASLEDNPDNPDALHALATDLMADNQLEAALPVYRQLVKIDPTDVQSIVKISEIQRRQGHYDQALETLNKARNLNGTADNLELSFNEAVLFDSLGRYDDAVGALKTVLNETNRPNGQYSEPEKSNRAIFLDRLAIVYNEQNKTADAVATYKQMAELGGMDYIIRADQGQIDTLRGAQQWKEALAVATDLAKQYPDNQGVQLMYAYQLADTGQPDQGLALAQKELDAAKSNTDKRDVQIAIGNIDFRLHRSAEALKHLEAADALAQKPEEHAYISLIRAQIYDHDKQYDQAEAQYRKALAVDPSNATVLNDLGYMLADRGVRLPEALKMIQQAVVLDPQNGAYLDSLGWVYFRLGQYGPAEENLQKAIGRTPTDASIHDHLGQLYEKTGRLKLAVEQWERSLAEYARSLPADAEPADVAKVKHELDDARTKLARNGGNPSKKS